jgi:hypothetical protein
MCFYHSCLLHWFPISLVLWLRWVVREVLDFLLANWIWFRVVLPLNWNKSEHVQKLSLWDLCFWVTTADIPTQYGRHITGVHNTTVLAAWRITVLTHFNFFMLCMILCIFTIREMLAEILSRSVQYLRIQAFRDVMLGCWVTGFRCFEGTTFY